MSIKAITGFLGFLFFLAAGVTWVAGEAGQGVEGRVASADIVGLILIGFWIVVCLTDRKLALKMPFEYRAYLPLLFVYALGVLFAMYPGRGILELVIHVFIFVVSLVLYNLYRRIPANEAVPLALKSILWAGWLLAAIGIIDFFIWPGLIPGIGNGLTGTFRNTGQAGAFFGMYLAILIPGVLSGLIPRTRFNMAMLATIVFALVFTSKRAAMIGLAVGLLVLGASLLFSPSKRDKKFGIAMIVVTALVAPLAYFAFLWGLENIEGMAWRFESKFNQGVAEDFQEGFLAENINAARAAFSVSPIVGVGLGNVAGVITAKYEIHSTYLAMLGNSGILGSLTYLYFMGVHSWQGFKSRGASAYVRYLRYYLPMLVGLAASWAYTYHLRKREFWIMFFVVSLVLYAARQVGDDRSRSEERVGPKHA